MCLDIYNPPIPAVPANNSGLKLTKSSGIPTTDGATLQGTSAFSHPKARGYYLHDVQEIDGDLPFIITTTAPTVAVPTTKGISKLSVDQKGGKKKIKPKKRRKR